jgi:hypothetical protein
MESVTRSEAETGLVFLVATLDHTSGAVLGQRQVPSKRGEGAAARDLLTDLNAPGKIWTPDALHTCKTTRPSDLQRPERPLRSGLSDCRLWRQNGGLRRVAAQ